MEPIRSEQWPPRRLRRPTEGRVVGGVAAGVADYLDVDVVVVRIALVALVLAGGAGLPLYVAAWLLMPEEGHDEAPAVGLVGRGVAMASRPAPPGEWPSGSSPSAPGSSAVPSAGPATASSGRTAPGAPGDRPGWSDRSERSDDVPAA